MTCLVDNPTAESFGHHQVNRRLNDFIHASPYIKYRIDLFAAGLEDNPSVNLTLADKRRAFEEYLTKWDTFNPIQQWERTIENFGSRVQINCPGVYGFIAGREKSIHLLVPESVSRRIPRREWKLSLPGILPQTFAIDPHADVLAVVERNETQVTSNVDPFTAY